MKHLLLLLLGVTLMASSCKKDEEPASANLKVRFTLTYDGQPLVFNQNQAYGQNFIRMTRFAFFLSNLNLRQGQDSVNLAELSFVDFATSNTTLAGATGGLVMSIPAVKTGTYTSIDLGIGLTKAVNATKPADYPSSHPLADGGYYWAGWNGYIFSKMEGKFDTLATGDFSNGYFFHTGLDENYKVVKLTSPIIVDGNKSDNEVHISLDVKKLFVKNGTQIDLKTDNQAHGPGNAEMIAALTSNYQSAFEIKN